jgi:hypothetical protein
MFTHFDPQILLILIYPVTIITANECLALSMCQDSPTGMYILGSFTILQGRCNHYHYTDGKTEAHRGQLTPNYIASDGFAFGGHDYL